MIRCRRWEWTSALWLLVVILQEHMVDTRPMGMDGRPTAIFVEQFKCKIDLQHGNLCCTAMADPNRDVKYFTIYRGSMQKVVFYWNQGKGMVQNWWKGRKVNCKLHKGRYEVTLKQVYADDYDMYWFHVYYDGGTEGMANSTVTPPPSASAHATSDRPSVKEQFNCEIQYGTMCCTGMADPNTDVKYFAIYRGDNQDVVFYWNQGKGTLQNWWKGRKVNWKLYAGKYEVTLEQIHADDYDIYWFHVFYDGDTQGMVNYSVTLPSKAPTITCTKPETPPKSSTATPGKQPNHSSIPFSIYGIVTLVFIAVISVLLCCSTTFRAFPCLWSSIADTCNKWGCHIGRLWSDTNSCNVEKQKKISAGSIRLDDMKGQVKDDQRQEPTSETQLIKETGISNESGTSSYRSAILQVLAHLRPVAELLMSHRCYEDPQRCRLCIVQKLMDSVRNGTVTVTDTYIDSIPELRHWYIGQQDALDYLQYILETAFMRLRAPFVRLEVITTKCYSCLSQIKREQESTHLAVPVDGDIKSVEDAIRRNFVPNSVDDYQCSSCKHVCKANRGSCLSKLGEVLVVQLNRVDTQGHKVTKKITLTKNLRLVEFMERNGSLANVSYELQAVIHHAGTQANGHYWVTINVDGMWKQYNDSEVKAPVIMENTDSESAYLLVYTRMNEA